MKKFAVLLAACASLAFASTASAHQAKSSASPKPCRITLVRWDSVADAAGHRFWQMWTPANCGLSLPASAWVFGTGGHKQILSGADYRRFAWLPFVNGLKVTLIVTPQQGGPATACSFTIRPANPPLRMALKNCP